MGVPLDPAHVSRLPNKPGVYMFRSDRGEILYVGKAKLVRARVRSYLARPQSHEVKTRELVRRAKTVDTLIVGTEAESLILEANLIKEHRPRFNIQLRDDKRYPFVRVTVGEPFPRVHVTRRVANDGSRYFGPFVSVGRLRRALDRINRIHGVRSCRYDLLREAPARPCLDHHIGRCGAPCVGLQSEEDYRAMIDRVVRVLSGDVADMQAEVIGAMRSAAAVMDYERAGRLRDVLAGLDGIAAQQRVHKVGAGDQDLIGVARDGSRSAVAVMQVRDGTLIGRHTQIMSGIEHESDGDLLRRAVTHAYLSSGSGVVAQLPPDVLLPGDFPDRELVETILSERVDRGVRLRVPRRGAKVRLVELAVENARHALDEQIRKGSMSWSYTDDALYELQDRLALKVVPRRMVCLDVSHIHGTDAVASAVVFENGKPLRSGYRHMRIKGEWGNDDYRSMTQAVTRYLRRDSARVVPIPDLVVVDGGKGQLRAAVGALAAQGMDDIAVVALAKREEEVFVPGRSAGIQIPRTARSLHLLQWIRNEAHRFAVRYNRKLRSRRAVGSALGGIPGIGTKRQRDLLIRFGSVRSVREATPEEIGRLPGFSNAMGVRILTYLKDGSG